MFSRAWIGASGARRDSVLARVGDAVRGAQAERAISAQRGAQIARHLGRASEAAEVSDAA